MAKSCAVKELTNSSQTFEPSNRWLDWRVVRQKKAAHQKESSLAKTCQTTGVGEGDGGPWTNSRKLLHETQRLGPTG